MVWVEQTIADVPPLPSLRSAARHRNIAGRSKKRKHELWQLLRHDEAAVRVQRMWRRHRLPEILNDRDPITHDPLHGNRGACFVHAVQSGKGCIAYNPTSLAAYIDQTGDNLDPVSRDPYSNSELTRLALQARCSPARLVKAVSRPAVATTTDENDLLDEDIMVMIVRDLETEATDNADHAALVGFILDQWRPVVGILSDIIAIRSGPDAVAPAMQVARQYCHDHIHGLPPPISQLVTDILTPRDPSSLRRDTLTQLLESLEPDATARLQ